LDENYQTYVNRLARLTLPTAYEGQLSNIQKSPKFSDRQPTPFPGYTLITPPQVEDWVNTEFYGHLSKIQAESHQEIADLLIPLPISSFHFTAANLIWDDRFRSAKKERPDFEGVLRRAIQASFEQFQVQRKLTNPPVWQILGMLVYPRALVVGLVPYNEEAYDDLTLLRRAIYQNRDLIGLGIDQQYHFTAHITLGYFDEIPGDLDRDRLSKLLAQFNDRWLDLPPQLFSLQQVQLRYFENMVQYSRQPEDPVLRLDGES
jgi:hypothetical protein